MLAWLVAETSDKQPDQVEEQTKKDEVEKEEVDEDSKKQDEKLQLERPDVEQKKEPVKESLQASQTEPVSKETKDESPKQSSTDKSSKSLQLALKIRSGVFYGMGLQYNCTGEMHHSIHYTTVLEGCISQYTRLLY